jgi:hypothetical protein
MPVSFSDLQLAFEFVSSGGMGENEAYLDRKSGKIYWHSEFGDNAVPSSGESASSQGRALRITAASPETPCPRLLPPAIERALSNSDTESHPAPDPLKR